MQGDQGRSDEKLYGGALVRVSESSDREYSKLNLVTVIRPFVQGSASFQLATYKPRITLKADKLARACTQARVR
jgi:hypothetical protein